MLSLAAPLGLDVAETGELRRGGAIQRETVRDERHFR
jgi:hypothetical protein